MNPEPNANSEPKPKPSPAEMFQRALEIRNNQFERAVIEKRTAIARRKGLLQPSVEYTPAELKDLVPIPEDKIRFATYPKGHKFAGQPRIAVDRFGLPALPKARGRRNRHMTKHEQAVKSAAIIIFRTLFGERKAVLEAEADVKGEKFVGIPEAELPKLGARATRMASQQVKATNAQYRRRTRNRTKLSRKINAEILPGNTNVHDYIIN